MVKLITFLLAFSISAFAEDYQIFDSLEGDLEVNKTISSKFKEQKINKENFCNGDYIIIDEAPIHELVNKPLQNQNLYEIYKNCFSRNSTEQNIEFKKFDGVISESSFLIPKNTDEVYTFDNFKLIWNKDDNEEFITINIQTSIKKKYTKYTSNIERFIKAQTTRLKNFKTTEELLTYDSDKRACLAKAELIKTNSLKCSPIYKYYFNPKDLKENSEIELKKEDSEVPIKYEIQIENERYIAYFDLSKGSYIVSFADWWNPRTEKNISVSVRCINCINKETKTKKILVSRLPKKVLKEGGGYDGTDDWKKEFEYENQFNRNGLIQEQKRREKINDSKKQCEEIGYVPGSKKFRDCVLELL